MRIGFQWFVWLLEGGGKRFQIIYRFYIWDFSHTVLVGVEVGNLTTIITIIYYSALLKLILYSFGSRNTLRTAIKKNSPRRRRLKDRRRKGKEDATPRLTAFKPRTSQVLLLRL